MKIFLWAFLVGFPFLTWAQSRVSGRVNNESGEALQGAHVSWKDGEAWTVTDVRGQFSLPYPATISGTPHLVISFVGYMSDTVAWNVSAVSLPDTAARTFVLKNEQTLEGVVVRAQGTGTFFSRMDPIHSQRISSAELQRAACCNLSESFETNASVDVAYNDAATGAKQIKLLGLSGGYVQMQTENLPGFRGVNASYGLDYIPGPWMESIQLSKGAASVKNGYESMTGQINVEYKKSEHSDPLTVNLYGADNGRMELNLDGAHRFNDHLSSNLFVHYSNDQQSHDANGDGFLDRPKLEQVNVMNRWNVQKGPWVSHFGAQWISDQRTSGQTGALTSSADPYNIQINNRHAEFYGKQGYLLGREQTGSVALMVSGSYTDFASQYGVYQYASREGHLYASLLFESDFSIRHRLSTGVSLLADWLDQQTAGFAPVQGNLPNRRDQWVPGVYVEYTYKPLYNLTVLSGLRADYHNRYGSFVTPRIHVKYEPMEGLHLRASAGKGFRSVNVLNGNNYLLASARMRKLSIEEDLPMEESLNYGLSASFFFPVFGKEMMISTEVYHTRFLNQVVTDLETATDAVSFYALKGKSYADHFQVEWSYPLLRHLDVRLAYRYVNTQTQYRTKKVQQALQSPNKGFVTASYKTSDTPGRWQIDYTLQLNGSGRMPTPDSVRPLWKERYGAFALTHVQVSKFFAWGSMYVGAENLFDYKQPNPVVGATDPFGEAFDATLIWGPLHGRSVYAGLRFTIPS